MLRLLVPLLALTGCAAHVTLPLVPSATAPEAERVRAHEELRPVAEPNNAPWPPGPAFPGQFGGFLLLNNGLRVTEPVDLLPAVDGASPTAGFVRAYEAESGKANVSLGVAFGMVLLGAVLEGVALSQIEATPGSTRGVPLLLAGAGTLLASLIPMTFALVFSSRAMVERQSAFLMYPRDLRQRLALAPEPPLPAVPPSPRLLPPVGP